MRNFDYTKLAQQKWDAEILSYVAKIHEYKGRQDLYVRQKPVELSRLVEVARIQSTEASNKIEGIVTTDTRMKQLLADKTTPRNRDESEIMGYREVLNTITQLAADGLTLVVVTHEMGFARNVSDRIIFMENGIVAEEAPAKEFFLHPKQEASKRFLRTVTDDFDYSI